MVSAVEMDSMKGPAHLLIQVIFAVLNRTTQILSLNIKR
jgi:hypothetical protein